MNTELHSIIQHNYHQVFRDKETRGTKLPFHLEREFNKYLKCQNPLYGMTRLKCPHCAHEKFVAFSCKGRTLCPSCTGRKMADTAKHLIEEVIPKVPVRQWVLSMPYTFRFMLATKPEFLRKSLAIFHRTIFGFYKIKAKLLKLKNPKTGAITVVQRFGGALNLNVHFHSLYMDGVFYENDEGKETFYEIIPTHEEIVLITKILKKRLTRFLVKNEDELILDTNFDSQLELQNFSVQNKDEFYKAPIKIGKTCDPPFNEFKASRIFYDDGFSLHANVKILPHLRDHLEKLCRYVLRGPIAKERISFKNNKVILKLKTPYTDGTTHLQFSSEQFIKRILSLIPPPRQNLIRYIGVFGARHKKRSLITILANPNKKIKTKKKSYRTNHSDLLRYVFKTEANDCEKCGTKLKVIAVIHSIVACQKILNHLDIKTTPIEIKQSRAPPVFDLFDQTFDFP